ncbi:MAG: excinuclease ABC subunit UvrC, partial [Hyphomicrobium sp.]
MKRDPADTAKETGGGPAKPAPGQPVTRQAAPVATGSEVIARYLTNLPAAPGVYRMLNEAGEVIYVGKARSLKSRVANYTRLQGHTNRIARMILSTATMEFVTVATEAEALLLEANLIKRFKPRFNVLMRDDKSFPYILISRDHAAPQVMKHRGARNRKGDYFGPFASAGAVSRAITMLQRAFLLRTCSDSFYENRTRPCLLYQIKRCAGPCTGEIELEEYRKLTDEAVRFLRGESQSVREMYQRLMTEAAEKLEFEDAAKFRNRLWALAHVTADQTINPDGVEEADVFAAHQEGGQTCIQVFFFRTGQNWGNRAYYPKADRSLPVEEVLDAFIAQFYDDKPVPRLILLSHEVANRALLAEALSTKAERKIEIRVPSRGTKSGLVDHALSNAREALGRKMAETSSQGRLLQAVAERFNLARVPRRVEVFDNSHISGTNAIGAMIVAGPEGFVKGQYRKFNIKSADLTPGDDYAMMREVLTRRFKRLTVDASATLLPGSSDAPPPRGEENGGPPPPYLAKPSSAWTGGKPGGEDSVTSAFE